MSQSIEFDTPENVQLSYRIAGLGSRFVAWFVDNIFVGILVFVITVCLAIAAVSASATIDRWLDNLFNSPDGENNLNEQEQVMRVTLVMVGLMFLVWGLGSFIYFFLTELFMRGQTPGKRIVGIRVVKQDGFALDAGSIFVRNIFRLVDQIPLLWIVPVIAPNSKRFGDMVGGTLVVSSDRHQINPLRNELLERERGEINFRFSAGTLEKLSADDVSTIEQFCERMFELEDQRRTGLLEKMVPPLAEKLNVESPDSEHYQSFLLDLLTAEYHRQERRLG